MHTDTIEKILEAHGQDVHNRLSYLRDVIKQMIEKKKKE